jgi:hypothetical protein
VTSRTTLVAVSAVQSADGRVADLDAPHGLLSPRGTAYFTIYPVLTGELTPHYAGWYAGDDPWSSIYGGPLRLAGDARRFDVSPAWHAWVAAARPCGYSPRWAPGPCTGTPLAWRTGSAPE